MFVIEALTPSDSFASLAAGVSIRGKLPPLKSDAPHAISAPVGIADTNRYDAPRLVLSPGWFGTVDISLRSPSDERTTKSLDIPNSHS